MPIAAGTGTWLWLVRRRTRAGAGSPGRYIRTTIAWLAIFIVVELGFWWLGCQIWTTANNSVL